MAKALPAGRAMRRRVVFGFFDADGWAWAFTKAMFWLLVIIMALGYIPDRAYYFFVSRTIELGILGWSPINLCPPENGTSMPCPVPAGGVLPWQAAPAEAALPQPRAGGVALQLGKNLIYAGGSDASGPTATSYLAQIDKDKFGPWSDGPALPEARTNAGLATLSGTAYLIGGAGPDGATTTVWRLGLDPDTSALKTWEPVCTVAETKEKPCPADKLLALPAARSGAAVVAVSDGIVVAGGLGPDGKPTNTVWKATADPKSGILTAFAEQPGLPLAVSDASAVFEGTFLWVYGGSDAAGPVGAVQRADYGSAPGPTAEPGAPAPSAAPEVVLKWTADNALNLPAGAARTGAAGFAANGALYLVGGSDGTSAKRELFWALPNSAGNLPGGWRHLDATDLPRGIADAAPLVTGATAVLIGGIGPDGPLATSMTVSLAPQEPVFRVGLVGVVVPGLRIGGEIGQQLGYLAAAGVGTGNFVILVAVGWAFNHREDIKAWRDRRRIAKEAKAPKEG